MNIYFTNAFVLGTGAELLERSFGKVIELSKPFGNRVVFPTETLNTLKNGNLFSDFFGAATQKELINKREAWFRGIQLIHVTKQSFRNVPTNLIYAPYVEIGFLKKLITQSMAPLINAVVYVPWNDTELIEFKNAYPGAISI